MPQVWFGHFFAEVLAYRLDKIRKAGRYHGANLVRALTTANQAGHQQAQKQPCEEHHSELIAEDRNLPLAGKKEAPQPAEVIVRARKGMLHNVFQRIPSRASG